MAPKALWAGANRTSIGAAHQGSICDAMNVVIVESAAKAKAINKYLGPDYRVMASYGHVRDLPSKDGSVEPENDFAMHWEADAKSSKLLNEIARAVKGADKLILATDPDREGEAISWHILEVLEKKRALEGVAVERVAFNAVTKQAVLEAIANPRQIDEPLVSAYLARRALDYLVGFTLSPVLWRKLPGSRSAGRVQSVALRLICDREEEIEAFKPREYWTIEALLKTAAGEEVASRLHSIDGKRLGKFDIADAEAAEAIRAALAGARFQIDTLASKAVKRHPAPPFTTSTLQQEAARKLGFSASRTMSIAQRLYEGVDLDGETVGLITYMRTDGVEIVPEAIAACREVIGEAFGRRYVPDKPRQYKTKAKNAQEAHEAIRPTSFARRPEEVARHLDKDAARLYGLVWQRAVASQMASAELERTTVDLSATGSDGRRYGFRAVGSVIKFDGFLKLYEEGRDDDKGEEARRLPPLEKGAQLTSEKIAAKQHFTEPPPRYSEATLVKKMEELGIGRPSTYASTIAVLRERGYVTDNKRRLVPEDKGRLVTAFLKSFFRRYVEYDFTASLEEKLDLISAGKLAWKDVLREFWREFTATVDEIKDLRVSEVLDALNEILGPHVFPPREDGSDPRQCPSCEDGRLSLKVGRYGAFIGCSNYPECRFTRQFSETGEAEGAAAKSEDRVLGIDPESGLEVWLKVGRFGPYLQLGAGGDGEKPKRASLPKGVDPATIDLEKALRYLSLPRTVGAHPETGKPIVAGFGRYGPFVEHDGTYANLEGPEEVFTVGLNRAVALLAEKAAGKGRRRGASPLRELGEHPEEGGMIAVYDGRYGPYVKHGRVNATIPKDMDPEAITLEEAVALIAARKEKLAGGKAGKARPARSAKGAGTAAKRSDGASGANPGRTTKRTSQKAAKSEKAGAGGKGRAKSKAAPRADGARADGAGADEARADEARVEGARADETPDPPATG